MKDFFKCWRAYGLSVAWRNFTFSLIRKRFRIKTLNVEYVGNKKAGLITSFNHEGEVFSYEICTSKDGDESYMRSDMGQGFDEERKVFATYLKMMQREAQFWIGSPDRVEKKMKITLNRVTYPAGLRSVKPVNVVYIGFSDFDYMKKLYPSRKKYTLRVKKEV